MNTNNKWITWIMKIQSIAQAGLFYGKDPYDQERYQQLREIAAEMMAEQNDLPVDITRNLFCNEIGYQTPKLDTRAAIIQNDKILLVQENNGTWSLPGGWVDLFESIRSNTEKEVKEEAGLDVKATRIIAVQDRDQHNKPRYAYGIIKVFVQCELLGGHFTSNIETLRSAYFSLDNLPPLAEEKNTREQIELCFTACHSDTWEAVFD